MGIEFWVAETMGGIMCISLSSDSVLVGKPDAHMSDDSRMKSEEDFLSKALCFISS